MGSHERTHTGEKPFACTICEKTFSDGSNLKKHQKIHTREKLFSCSKCEETFSNSSHMKAHERTHTGETLYACSMKFTDIGEDDERVHKRVKPHTCTTCGKVFNQKYNLMTHERTHTGEKPFSCSKCDKRFRHSS